jgi:hypothetical protein
VGLPIHRRLRVLRLVEQTRAIRWWIDKQIADGKTDEQIEAELPLATAFITGRVSLPDLQRSISGVTSTSKQEYGT